VRFGAGTSGKNGDGATTEWEKWRWSNNSSSSSSSSAVS